MSVAERGATTMSVEAEERITRNLIEALERLHEDLDRVELWTAALDCFAAAPHPNTSPASSTCCRRSASRGHSAPADSSRSATGSAVAWSAPTSPWTRR